MVKIKPFKGIRPPRELAKEVASRPYDVLNSAEAKAEAGEKSLLHIIKPEIDFEPMIDEHSTQAYDHAVANFKKWKANGWLVQDDEKCYYVYAQTMEGRTQYGLVAACHFEDYVAGRIKKHELTRPDKEEDRMIHVWRQEANIEPVFFAYPARGEVDAIIDRVVTTREPVYDFVAEGDGFGHRFWVIDEEGVIARLTELFAEVPALYVADGHHRTAAAARVGAEKKEALLDAGGTYTGEEEFNYFLAVIFPDNQLKIIDYNRVVRDLNGLRTYITSQNHGYAVDAGSVKRGRVSFANANDGTCEGLDYPGLRAFTVQFHPEARGGPHDTAFLFDRFVEWMKGGER